MMKVTDWHTDWLMISWNTAANQKVTPPPRLINGP